jgi:hypothetical protein
VNPRETITVIAGAVVTATALCGGFVLLMQTGWFP